MVIVAIWRVSESVGPFIESMGPFDLDNWGHLFSKWPPVVPFGGQFGPLMCQCGPHMNQLGRLGSQWCPLLGQRGPLMDKWDPLVSQWGRW